MSNHAKRFTLVDPTENTMPNTTTFVDVTPTKQGFRSMARMFATEQELAHARVRHAEGLLDRDLADMDEADLELVRAALEAFRGTERSRAARLGEAVAEAQKGAA